eukprot:7175-Heterococcus_DN1.PRE.2
MHEPEIGGRVRVRFDSHKWYGGTLTEVDQKRGVIHILYDDQTDEEASYPDADIVIYPWRPVQRDSSPVPPPQPYSDSHKAHKRHRSSDQDDSAAEESTDAQQQQQQQHYKRGSSSKRSKRDRERADSSASSGSSSGHKRRSSSEGGDSLRHHSEKRAALGASQLRERSRSDVVGTSSSGSSGRSSGSTAAAAAVMKAGSDSKSSSNSSSNGARTATSTSTAAQPRPSKKHHDAAAATAAANVAEQKSIAEADSLLQHAPKTSSSETDKSIAEPAAVSSVAAAAVPIAEHAKADPVVAAIVIERTGEIPQRRGLQVRSTLSTTSTALAALTIAECDHLVAQMMQTAATMPLALLHCSFSARLVA